MSVLPPLAAVRLRTHVGSPSEVDDRGDEPGRTAGRVFGRPGGADHSLRLSGLDRRAADNDPEGQPEPDNQPEPYAHSYGDPTAGPCRRGPGAPRHRHPG